MPRKIIRRVSRIIHVAVTKELSQKLSKIGILVNAENSLKKVLTVVEGDINLVAK